MKRPRSSCSASRLCRSQVITYRPDDPKADKTPAKGLITSAVSRPRNSKVRERTPDEAGVMIEQGLLRGNVLLQHLSAQFSRAGDVVHLVYDNTDLTIGRLTP